MKVKVRLAPSPTGYLHIGTARAGLFNWLFAKKMGGEFILRIEDTDLERSDKKYDENIIESLKWLGLDWNGEIYRQSERLSIYREYIEKLLKEKKAFWCHHSKEELEQEQKEQMAGKEAPRHLCDHKNKNLKEKEGAIIRLNVNTGSKEPRTFHDLIRGDIKWSENLLGDISIAKNLNTPLYNFAVVIDDMDMQISHVIRGEDHISNTPKQILIYEALGAKLPEFAHLPLILAPDRSKLSKRHGATSVTEFKQDYLPESLVNFMGFLGYTYSMDIISKEEMADEFELGKVHKSGAIFDVKKLNWINSQHLKNVGINRLRDLSGISDITEDALPLITERLEKISEIRNYSYFWKEPEYDRELLKWKKADLEKSIKTLTEVKKLIEEFDFNRGKEELRKILDDFSSGIGDRGLAYWPLRVSLTGKDKSPDPIDIAFALGKEKVLKRINSAVK